MDAGSNDRTPAVKIGDRIRLIHAADPYMGIKSKDIGTIVDYSISKVIDLDELRLVIWIKWENGKESAIVDGIDSIEIL
jgi:hypothetical protein